MKLTIKDIARLADVSTATVSRVINNVDLNKVSKETRDRVKSIIKEHKYVPDMAGFSLATGKKTTLGLIIPGENFLVYSYYFSEILRGVVRAANESSYKLILLTYEVDGAEAYKNIVRSKSVEGLIFVGSEINDKRVFELKKENIPFVLVNNYIQGQDICYIDSNNRQGAFKATEYLIQLGHKKIAFIRGPEISMNAEDRYTGFKEAMKEYHIPIHREFVRTGNFNREISYRVICDILKLKDWPTAIFAADDTMCISALEAVRHVGLNVPDDISLVGFNNSPESVVVTPRLTTVEQNIFSLGYEAGNLLISQIREKNPGFMHKLINTSLIIRDSCREV